MIYFIIAMLISGAILVLSIIYDAYQESKRQRAKVEFLRRIVENCRRKERVS